VSAIAYGQAGIWPASLVLEGEYGISDVSLSVPVSLGRDGAEEIHE
jgi:malate dehydrogenase